MNLLEISVCGSVLILLGTLLRRFRLPKDACMVLWWAAALRLLVPWALPARWSAYTFLRTLLRTLRMKPEAVIPVTGPPVTVLPPLEALPVVPAAPEIAPVESAEPFPFRTVLWAAGTLLLAVWFAVSYVRWRRRFREAVPAECGFLEIWNRQHPRVRVRVSDRIAAPLTYGFFRPVILLPKTFDLSDDSALLCILTHELVHIRRLDGLLKLLLSAALCVHWFNPAAWLLWVLAGRDMELRCDQAALGRLGSGQRAAYALTLLRMAELRNESMPLYNSFSEYGMEERIQAIMKFKKPSVLVLTAALALVLCVTAAFATTAWKEPPAEPAADLSAEDAVLALRMLDASIQFEDGTFYFTIPSEVSGESRWNIWISGRILTASNKESGMVMSVHYLEDESEKGEWTAGKTYSFQTADAAYDELIMTAAYGGEELTFDLTYYLPDGLVPLEVPELPESKPGVPEDGGGDGAMVWPVDSGTISSAVGSFNPNPNGEGEIVHNGVDIAGMETGDPVYAAGQGTVKASGFDCKSGNYVLLDHGGGLETYYSACETILVSSGETVKRGQTIATIGKTGMSTGPHLHFEIRKDGVQQNPFLYAHSDDLLYAYKSIYPDAFREGDPFYAPMDGTVISVYPTSFDYLELVMDYGGNIHSYSNCATVAVKPGDSIRQDDLLGTAKGPMAFGGGVTTEEYLRSMNQRAEEALVDGDYPRTAAGLTYAPCETLAEVTGYPPDLLAWTADNGQQGYVLTKEHNQALEKYTELNGAESVSFPVYDLDGNVIGESTYAAIGPTVTTYYQDENGENSFSITTNAPKEPAD